jgi:subtilisin family serine protease
MRAKSISISEAIWFKKLRIFDEALPPNGLQGDIKVAILDSGIDAGHEEFQNCIHSRKSFVPGAHDFLDSNGHGTHMAGLIQKVAPNAKLLIGRIFDGSSLNQQHAAEVRLFCYG